MHQRVSCLNDRAKLTSAYRGYARIFLKDLEAIRPSAILDIIRSGESFVLDQKTQKSMKALRGCSSPYSH